MNRNGLPESLRNSREFRLVYEKGRRYSSPYFNIFVLRTGSSEPRLGLTVTKKIGDAVVRNRCKRRLREIVRHYFNERRGASRVVGGIDFVINARSSLPAAEYHLVEESFRKLMEMIFGPVAGS
ncbi:MAG: ribonuclease P protein component [Acidobacteriota bacterium]|jgi:ribonuclease P protein component